ncbi:hypothetical protein FE257_000767 [Aspergillus nanangensis]|uniref:Major facilitator superfamily (MFS) profile domain-containing protein n=1 Tax=Aspergillus nanangensis TaxID=2582783 RepID=A0AAD4CEJ4_ASPNN|nr:hypothetical protein FE257_000767 [Aspergillus nanangensis]
MSLTENDQTSDNCVGVTPEKSPADDKQTRSRVSPRYFHSGLFLGTYAAVVVSIMSGVAPYALAAPLLTDINVDIGPSPDIAWVGYSYNLVLACSLSLVGRLSDIFGRRWFFISGNFLALIGTIICAAALNVPMLIGGMVIASLGIATQLSFQYVLGELVPVGQRFIVMSTVFPWTMPLVRWIWSRGLSSIPSIHRFEVALVFLVVRHIERDLHVIALRELDWIGMAMFASGLFLFLMGLAWGGNAYPWGSAAVLCPLIVGILLLGALIVWEVKAKLEVPFIPTRLFRNGRWVAMMLCLGIGATQYYALALVWPKMIASLWPDKVARIPLGSGLLAVLTGGGLILGQIVGALIANWVNKRSLLLFSSTVGATFLAAAAVSNEHNLSTVLGVLIPGFLGIGVQEAVAGVFCTVALKDQADIGVGGGLAATTRAGLSALGSVIYNVILDNRLAKTVPSLVGKVAQNVSLPSQSVPALIQYLQGTGSAEVVAGLSQEAMDSLITAYRTANSLAFRDVMLTTLAFGGCSVICAFFTPKIDAAQAEVVSRVLERETKLQQGENSLEKD